MLALDTGRYDVIIGLLGKYHAVIGCRNKKVIFKILHQPEDQFIGECNYTREKKQMNYVIIEVNKKRSASVG